MLGPGRILDNTCRSAVAFTQILGTGTNYDARCLDNALGSLISCHGGRHPLPGTSPGDRSGQTGADQRPHLGQTCGARRKRQRNTEGVRKCLIDTPRGQWLKGSSATRQRNGQPKARGPVRRRDTQAHDDASNLVLLA